MPPSAIPFFTDHCVADSVGAALLAAGHQVVRLRDAMDPATADPVVATACAKSGYILVTHDKDFRKTSKRLGITQRNYQKSLHRIDLRCPEPEAAQRIKDAMSLIEAEWLLATHERPMVIEINSASIRTCR